MKKRLFFLLYAGALCFLTACQKEVSFELNGAASSGTLQADAGGECLPKTVQGIYETGKVLDAAVNFIDVQLSATTPGAYRVYSDTINGIYFQATGSLASMGLSTVRLVGTGTPLDAGTHDFTIFYDGSSCTVPVTTQAAGSAGNAVFTLAGEPGTCQDPVKSGDYIAGQAMTPANTVVIAVNVTVVGNYSIASIESNGIIFSGTGVLTNTGAQTITLTASGTPNVAGPTNIPLTAGAGNCTFNIDVADAPELDYFPLTAGSNWSYQYDGNANDSLLLRAKAGTVDIAGNPFTVFEGTVDLANDGFYDVAAYRKVGGIYITYLDVGQFFGFDDPQSVELEFLRDNVAEGSGWLSTGYTGNVTDNSGTASFTIRFSYTIAQKDVTVTVGGTSYPNTIVVNEKYELLNGANWLDATPVIGYYKSYYARDIGLIRQEYYYEDGNANPSTVILTQDLRRHVVL